MTKRARPARKQRSRYTLRRATLADLEVLVAQRRRMWEDLGEHDAAQLDAADAVYRRWARARLRSGRLLAWLAVKDGAVVAGGCLWLQDIQPRPGWPKAVQPYILSMSTAPEHRGHGLAGRIVDAMLAWASEEGYPRVALHASEEGRPIYAKRGFARTWEMRADLKAKDERC